MLSLLRFLFRNLKGYRFLVFIAMIMAILQVVSTIFIASPTRYIPNKLQPNGIDPEPYWSGIISFFDQFDTAEHREHFLKLGQHTALGVILFSVALLVVFAMLTALMTYVQLYLSAFLAQNLSARLRKLLFEHLQRLSLDWHGKQKKGDLVQRVTGNIADIEKFMTDALVDLLPGSLTIFGIIGYMLYVNWQFTLLSIVIVAALALVVFTYTTSIKRAAKKTSKAAGEVADVAVEDVGAISVVKAFTLEEREVQRFGKYVDKTRESALRAGSLAAQFNPIVTVLIALGTAIIIGVGSYVAAGYQFSFLLTISPNHLHVGDVFFFVTLLVLLFQPFKDLSKLSNVLNSASAGAERIQEVLDQAPEVLESSMPYTGPSRLRGDIAFENVLFGYTPEKLILKGINLHIPAGKKVALVGLSGGGKTTLVKLIPRFYEVTQGSVKVDGFDTRMYPLSVLRQNVGMVLQESVLFEGTVLDNLKIGRPDATMEEVIDAAKQAQIHDAIMGFPDGYNTMVRNQGKNFSGGQRQRMAIARAILSKAPILILDEPTANLDVEAEAEVMNALDKLVVGRTVLMISYRLSTLGQVDEIIVLKDGRIVEQGSYKELRRAGGVFAGLLKEQNRYNVEDVVGKSIVASRFGDIAGDYGMRQAPPAAPRMPVTPPSPQPLPLGRQNRPAGAGNVPIPGAGGYPQNGGQQRRAQEGNIPQQGFRSDKAQVLVEIDGKIVREQPLNKPILTVGRLSSNDIPVLVDRVSRLHARIRWENGSWLIEDADSLNGISYQGTRVDKHVFTNGDRIMLAPRAVLHFREDALKTSKAAGEVADVAVEDVGAITVVKAFTLEGREVQRFNKYVDKTRESALEVQSQFLSEGGQEESALLGKNVVEADDIKLIALFAIARATLENDDIAFVGKAYSVQAGVSQSKPENFAGEPFDLTVPTLTKYIPFDILLHESENIELSTEWHKRLLYDPLNLKPQLVEFTFQVMVSGHSTLVVDFYQDRRWLRTVRLEFDAVEKSQLTTVPVEV